MVTGRTFSSSVYRDPVVGITQVPSSFEVDTVTVAPFLTVAQWDAIRPLGGEVVRFDSGVVMLGPADAIEFSGGVTQFNSAGFGVTAVGVYPVYAAGDKERTAPVGYAQRVLLSMPAATGTMFVQPEMVAALPDIHFPGSSYMPHNAILSPALSTARRDNGLVNAMPAVLRCLAKGAIAIRFLLTVDAVGDSLSPFVFGRRVRGEAQRTRKR